MQTATLGSGVLTAWLYGAFADANGWPPMPPEVAAAVAGLMMGLVERFLG